jgi:hypothetical protein
MCSLAEGGLRKEISEDISQNEIGILKLALLLSQEVFPGVKTDKYLNEINGMINDIKKDIYKKTRPLL